MLIDPRAFLVSLFGTAVAAAQPHCLSWGLPTPPRGRVVVVGAGKAAAAMARTFEEQWREPVSGLVVTPYGHGIPCERIEVVEAAHPVPDERGREAAVRILALAEELTADDLLVCLFSGGGSALLALPAPGITLQDKQTVSRALLRCGAPIDDINCLRKHLSAIKGGRLAAAAHPARVITYLVSDVPGDDPTVIASGPTTPDRTTYGDALAALGRWAVKGPAAVEARLLAGAGATSDVGLHDDLPDETPKPSDPKFARDEVIVLATAADAMAAVAAVARSASVTPLLLGDDLQGEARRLGAEHARLVFAHASGGSCRLPCVIVSGGETTVTVRGSGRGGRNAEYLLSLAIALGGHPGVWAIACDTDGIDGTEDNAGAIVGPSTLSRARAAGLDPERHLATNDAYALFATLEDLVVTGPTRTNVNDFRAILILDESRPGGCSAVDALSSD